MANLIQPLQPSYSLQYLDKLQHILAAALSNQQTTLQIAAEKIAVSLRQGGILHVFGSGHSHMLAEELYVRAGGLAPINAILIPELMLHENVERASLLERQPEYADSVLEGQDWRIGDVLLVISNSGSNGLPVEMALRGRQAGLFTIALTSLSFSRTLDARHPSGKRLFEAADLVLDNYGQPGDACLKIPGTAANCGPTSTVVGAALLNALMAETIDRLVREGSHPPIFVSGNFANDVRPALETVKSVGKRWHPGAVE
jgi:uncharacterized phosphosugar-binding protein